MRTPRLKTGAYRSKELPRVQRAESRRRYALARPWSMFRSTTNQLAAIPRARDEVGFSPYRTQGHSLSVACVDTHGAAGQRLRELVFTALNENARELVPAFPSERYWIRVQLRPP